MEKRYRERYVDLFASPDVAQVFRARALVVQQIRRVLDERAFLEVEAVAADRHAFTKSILLTTVCCC